jgi:hypothetical protein
MQAAAGYDVADGLGQIVEPPARGRDLQLVLQHEAHGFALWKVFSHGYSRDISLQSALDYKTLAAAVDLPAHRTS